MADIESNVKVNIDTSDALAQLKLLQQQISAFQQAMAKAGADNALAARQMQQNLVNSVNATGKFQANIQTIQTSAERFTSALEKNKLTMGEYFRYAGGASKTFGKLFKSEFETINQVARERVKELQTQYIKLGRDANGAMKAIAVKPLALDMDNLGTKTQMAAQRQQLFNQLMKQGSTQLLNFGKNTQWAGRQLMVGFTVPLTLMGSAAAKAYMEIEKASISFKRVYGDINTTADETEKMAKSVRGLANEFTKYGASVADTMEMAAKAAAMGKTGADLLAQISQAAKLAVLGQVDQNQALETTISLTNAFGVSAADLGKNIDFLNAVENQTVTSIEDLTVAIPKAAPVVKQLGGDVEDLAFFLTAMKEGGINASEGANALKSGLASMINPSKKASDFLAGFNINVKGIVEANKGDVRGTVIGMAKAFDTLDPLNRARAIEQLFGKFQFSRISTLFQNVIKEGSQANTVAGLAKQTAEELAVLSEREMKKISDSPMYKFQKSLQDIQAKLAPVGEAFLKAITPIVEFVGKLLDGFNNLSQGSKQFITILVTAVAGIGPLLLMTFGLVANGVANIMKLFTNIKSFMNKTTKPSDILGEQTGYMNTEQLRAAAIAASLDQAHAKLRQTFTSETAAVQQLTDAYRNAVQAQQAFSGVPGVPVGNPNVTPKKYANGVSMVPGPAGAGDIVPALLSPGEAVIPAKHARKYAPVIAGMVAGNLPGFENGTTGAGMRQSVYGPLTQKQTEGLGRTGLQLKEISDEVKAGPYGNVPPTDFGTQISPTTGHSFPAFSVGGIYEKPDGTRVFVKPQMDLTSALAEVRGTTIARDAHDLVAPQQTIRVMMDPTDPENQRKFIVLESALDARIADIPNTFTQDQYFKQLVASLLRGDKDLGVGNLGGDVLADVGTAGVFGRASGKRALGSAINSMEEQAIINLLGVKGGAKRFFAESTSEIASKLSPAEYDAAMKAEIARVAPKLQATIAGFGNLSPEEKVAYEAMQQRLQAGMGVDWGKYQVMHSAVPPKKFFDGVENVLPGKDKKEQTDAVGKFLQNISKASYKDYNDFFGLQDTHIVAELKKDSPEVLKTISQAAGFSVDAQMLKDSPMQILGNVTATLPSKINQRMKESNKGLPGTVFSNLWNMFSGKLDKISSIAKLSPSTATSLDTEIGSQSRSLNPASDKSVAELVGKILASKPEFKSVLEQAAMPGTYRNFFASKDQSSAIYKLIQEGKLKFNSTGSSIDIDVSKAGSTLTEDQRGFFRSARFNSDNYKFKPEEILSSKIGVADKAIIADIIQDNYLRENVKKSLLSWDKGAKLPEAARNAILTATDISSLESTVESATWATMSDAQKKDKIKQLITQNQLKPTLANPQGISLKSSSAKVGSFTANKKNELPKGQVAYDTNSLSADFKLNPSVNAWTAFRQLQDEGIFAGATQTKTNESSLGFFNRILKLAKGGIIPGYADGVGNVTGKTKPKASVFDIDDTLLDLSSFMEKHKAENDKLPEGEKKKWYKEAAKDPKGIPAAIERLKAAQARGNKILLMTARPDFYEPYTIETLQKLGIDMNGIKVIARRDKDYRKPEQMKYDKTSAYMKYYDIEEFYDDMAATRGAISLLGIPTYNPLKLAGGAFSVPGPKGAGDVVPAMLSPGEAVIPADKAEQHRGLIQQMIAGKLPGYNKGTVSVPGYVFGKDNVKKIPGVEQPASIDPDTTQKMLEKIKTSLTGLKVSVSSASEKLLEGAKKAGQVLKEKSLDAAETIGVEVVKAITAGTSNIADRKDNTRYDAKTGETKNKKGEVVSKEDKKAKLEEEKLKKDDKILKLTREQIEQEISLTDKEYEAKLERQKLLKSKLRLSDEEKKELQKNDQYLLQKEEKYMGDRNIEEKKKTGIQRAFTRGKGTAKVQSIAYGATGLGSVASMIPENVLPGVGQAVQSAMPAIGAFTGAMSMIPGPAGMVVGGLLAVATIAGQIDEALRKMRDEAYKTTMALGAGNKAIGHFAEFAKKATGTEIMDKQRAASGGQFFNVVEGKTTFGESYMKTDAGKDLVKGVSAAIKSGDLQSAEQQISQQLATAVAAGALNPAQARSIAANLGKSLNNATFGINVAGNITQMFGPDGENLKNSPLETRLRISKESVNTFNASMDDAAAKVDAAQGTWDIWGKVAEAGGAVAANYQSMLESQQQLVDSLEVEYQRRIAGALAAKDTAKAAGLENQYLIDRAAMLKANKEQRIEAQTKMSTLDGGIVAGAKDASIEAIAKNYEGTGLEGDASVAQSLIKDKFSGSTDKTKLNLASAVASKEIGLTQLTKAQELFGADATGSTNLDNLITNLGGTEANRAIGLTQNMDKEGGKQFLVDLALKDPEQAKIAVDALEMTQKTIGPFGGDTLTQKAIIEFGVTHQDQIIETKKQIDDLKKLSGNKITLALEAGKLGPKVAEAIKRDVKRFNKYNDANKIVYTTELKQILEMEGDPAMMSAFRLWQQEVGGPKSTFADYASYQADRTVQTQGADNTTGPGSAKEKGEAKAPDPSILDPYVKMLREANNYQQKLTVGWNDSFKAIMKYTSASIKQMGGFAVMMQQSGAAAEEIQAFMNGTEEEQNRIVDKKTGKLRKNATELLAKLKQIREASEIGLKYILMSPAEKLAKDNELYQAGLDVIATKEKKVNDKYNARIKALDEIGKLQERNNQKQADTLTLADALSKGDIAAAAKAALQAQQNSQKQALEDAKANLEAARKNELESIEVSINGVLTNRLTLEATLEGNAERIAGYKLKEAQRVADIEQNALKSAKHMAAMLASGKALSLLKPYNPGTPGGGPINPTDTSGVSLSAAAAKVGVGANGQKVVNTAGNALAAAAGAAMGGAAAQDAAKTYAWDFKNKKFVKAKVDQNNGAKGYVQDEKTPGVWVKQTSSEFANNKTTFATEAAANKAKTSDVESVEWVYNAAANEGVFQFKYKSGSAMKPKTAKLNDKSTYDSPQTMTVQEGKYFNLPAGAYYYGYTKTKEDGVPAYAIKFGASPTYRYEGTSMVETQPAFGTSLLSNSDTFKDSGQLAYSTNNFNDYRSITAPIAQFAMGGMVYANKGMKIAKSKYALGTDTIPAMLTPGEFVMRKSAVDSIGAGKLQSMNNGARGGESVYNYSITVNANSSDANDIADAVLNQIKRIDSRRIRSSTI
jgi:TP901 family phage tail tape measure protein